MSLSQKILFFVGFVYVLTIASIFLISKTIIETNFNTIEERELENNLNRVTAALHEKQKAIGTTASDYAGWDDTYQYIQDKNPEYEESNLVTETFVGLKLNFIMYLNSDNQIVFAKSVDYSLGEEADLPIDVVTNIVNNESFTNFDTLNQVNYGLSKAGNGIILLQSAPIITSKKEGPIMGVVIFGRLLDGEMLNEISSTTNLPVEISYYDQETSNLSEKIKASLNTNKVVLDSDRTDRIFGYKRIEDLLSEPNVLVSVNTSREIQQQGKNLTTLFMMVFSSTGVVSMILGYLYLRKILVTPLKHLTKQLAEIKRSANPRKRINVQNHHDEISFISTEINTMLSAIEHSTEQLMKLNEELSTQKKEVENLVLKRTSQLTEEHLRLLSAIDNSPYGFVLIDLNKKVVMKNKVLSNILGTQNISFEILSQELLAVNLDTAFDEVTKTIKAKFSDDVEYKGKILRIYLSPILENYKKVHGVIVTIDDVTEEKLLDRSKNEFLTIASHELRTPLTAIKGNTAMIKEMFLDKVNDKKFSKMIDDISTATQRMLHILTDFLTTSRLEHGKLVYSMESFDLKELILSTKQECEAMTINKHNNCELEVTDISEKYVVHGDKEKTKQVMINLVNNANKFTDNGVIKIKLGKKDEMVVTEVSDTGIGIPIENQKLLFRKFQQAGSSIYARDVSQGTGLGLYISKMLAEGMGGSLRLLKSEEGKGSTFVFTLNAAQE